MLDVDKVWACIGGTPHAIGESVSDMLNWVPAQRHVVRIARCRKVVQVTAPERRLIAGLATPAPLVQVLVKMYCDHTLRLTDGRKSLSGMAGSQPLDARRLVDGAG